MRLLVLISVLGSAHGQEGMRQHGDEEKAAEAPAMVVTKAPQLLKFVQPTYPEAAVSSGAEAAVRLILTIGADGVVSEAVLAAEPVGLGFDEAALAAAKGLEFSPAHINGAPAAIRIGYTFRFKFTPPTEAPPPEEQAPEKARIVGQVRERGTRIPVVGAPVGIAKAGLEASADALGNFTLEVPPGTHLVAATSPDHRRDTLEVTLKADEEVRIDFILERLRKSPFETIVRGKREQTSLTRRTLEREEMRTVPGTFGDPLRVLQNLPGVNRAPFIVGVLLIRGSGPGDSATLIDGHEVPLLYHFLGGPSVLPPEMLGRIDFFPGNFTVRYGRAIGGIVDVETRAPDPKRWHGSADFDIFDAGAFFEGPLTETIAVAGSARRSYVDALLPIADEFTEADLGVVVPVYWDYQTRADWRPNNKNRFSLLAFGSRDDLEFTGDQDSVDSQSLKAGIGFHRLKFEWKGTPEKDIDWSISPVVGVDRTSLESGDIVIDGTAFEYALRADLRVATEDWLVLRTGVDLLGRFVSFTADTPLRFPDYRLYPGSGFRSQQTTNVEREVLLNAGAVYMEGELTLGDFVLNPGLRFDAYHWFDRNVFGVDPRFNARWTLNETWALKGGVGLFSQAPTEFRLDEEFGNPDLKLERAEHYGLGVEYRISEAVKLDLQGFLALRSDLVQPSAEPAEGELEPERFNNEGVGRSYGVEVLLKHQPTKRLYGWISYTLSRSEERHADDEDFELFPLDQTHILTMVASYQFGDGWETGLRFRLVSGNPTTPITGSTFNADHGGYAQEFGVQNSERQSLFNQLDLRIEKTWTYTAWRFSAYLDVQNVYNATNPEFTTYDYRFRDSQDIPGIPVLPTIGFRGRF